MPPSLEIPVAEPAPTLTEAPVRTTLASMALPSTIGGIAFLGIFVTDAYFVGQLGTGPLATLGFLFPALIALMYVAIAFGVGAGAVVGRHIGAGDRPAARAAATNALLLAQLSMALLWVAGIGFGGPAFALFGTPSEFLAPLVAYLVVALGGMFVMAFGVTGGAILRADGDAGVPAIAMLLCAVVNLFMDPLLIFGLGPVPALGLVGAAWATLAGASAGVCLTGFTLLRRGLIAWPTAALQHASRDFRAVASITGPAAGVQMLMPATLALITGMITPYGATAVAAFAVGARIELLALVPLIALSTALSSFVAQNSSAARWERVSQAVTTSLHFCLLWTLLLMALMALGAPEIVAVFSNDASVAATLTRYASWVVPTAGFVGLVNLVYGSLNALHRPGAATFLSLARIALCYLPGAYIGSRWFGLDGLFVGIAVANLAAGAATYAMTRANLARLTT
jgi:putative MATE family efflux protein